MNYEEQSKLKINLGNIPITPLERCSQSVLNLFENEYIIDVHSHLFDIKCINKTYFIIRFLKDFLGIKSGGELHVEYSEDELYKRINNYEENWEDDFIEELSKADQDIVIKSNEKKGIIDLISATKFLRFKKMKDVYMYYIRKFSLAYHFKLPKENVLVTALMMDLNIGWDVKIKKSILEQIKELKNLSLEKPVLPFLFCDPRRADLSEEKENLYSLFNIAFCEGQSFFGVKIYPALGYDPSDYRLWPIYKICEELKIPVISHCGGESISTDKINLEVYEGDVKKTLIAKKRKEMAYMLNDPNRWSLVLEKFPNLKLNLAHFGGYETWYSSSPVSKEKDPQQRKECIIKFMNKYANVYSDFSYNLVEIDLSKNLKNSLYFSEILRERTLFGTDYWVVNKEGNLHREQSRFLNIIDEGIEELNLSRRLCLDNPKRFLFD